MKILPNGIAVLENDSHISKWVEQSGRLDHDQNTLPLILPYIKPGDTVVDAGAFIGDHTFAYLEAVGPKGKVYAFEPNPDAFECLKRNCWHGDIINAGLHEIGGQVYFQKSPNAGASRVSLESTYKVQVYTLDSFDLEALHFMKLDIEGCELEALFGADKTIRRHKPVMLIEINQGALKQQGSTKEDIFQHLEHLGYEWKMLWPNLKESDPQYDIICTPKK